MSQAPRDRAALLVVLYALALGGCELIVGTPVGDYVFPGDASDSGDAGDEVAAEARGGPDSPDGPDGPAEADAADAADAADEPEGAIAGDGRAAPFCQGLSPPPVFCDDFDENEPDPYGWSYEHLTTGSLVLDTSEFVSSPASLLAQTGVVAAGKTVDTSVYETLQLTGQSFDATLELELRVDSAAAPGGVAVLAEFELTDGGGGGLYVLQLVTTSNGAQPLSLQVAEDYFATSTTGQPVDHPASSVIPLGTWTRVKLSMVVPFAGGAGTATLVINDDPPCASAIQVPVQNFAPAIGVGILYATTPSNGWSAAVDNVVFNTASN